MVTPIVRLREPALRDALRLAAAFAAMKLLLHLAANLWETHIGWGYFRDEFYYLACGRHLAWGYVDHGPLVALQARVSELLFGRSLAGLRLLAAAAGAARVFLGTPLSMPFEHKYVYLVRGKKFNLDELWPKKKDYI